MLLIESIRCRLMISKRIIEQVMQIEYLVTRIISDDSGDRETEHHYQRKLEPPGI